MKIFNFGACTSSETKSLKKEIKSINEQIKSIKSIESQTNETKLSGLARQIDAIKSRVDKLDAKHQAKVTNSSGYASMTLSSCSIGTTLNRLKDKKEAAQAAQAAQARQAASKNAEATLELEKMFEKEPSLRRSMQPMIDKKGAAYALTTLKYSREGKVNREIQKEKNLKDAQLVAQNKSQHNQPRRDDWT